MRAWYMMWRDVMCCADCPLYGAVASYLHSGHIRWLERNSATSMSSSRKERNEGRLKYSFGVVFGSFERSLERCMRSIRLQAA